MYFFPFPVSINFLRLSWMFNISQILYLFLQLEILESHSRMSSRENAECCCWPSSKGD
jgi:hypothetical protein